MRYVLAISALLGSTVGCALGGDNPGNDDFGTDLELRHIGVTLTAPRADERFASGTTQVTLQATTSQFANCRYAVNGLTVVAFPLSGRAHSAPVQVQAGEYSVIVYCEYGGAFGQAGVRFSVAS